jgi:hypothetical protein
VNRNGGGIREDEKKERKKERERERERGRGREREEGLVQVILTTSTGEMEKAYTLGLFGSGS